MGLELFVPIALPAFFHISNIFLVLFTNLSVGAALGFAQELARYVVGRASEVRSFVDFYTKD